MVKVLTWNLGFGVKICSCGYGEMIFEILIKISHAYKQDSFIAYMHGFGFLLCWAFM